MRRIVQSLATLLLLLTVLDCAAFTCVAIFGIHLGVTDPFPKWFANATDTCFFTAIALLILSLASLIFLPGSKAGLSAAIALALMMVIAYLTTKG